MVKHAKRVVPLLFGALMFGSLAGGLTAAGAKETPIFVEEAWATAAPAGVTESAVHLIFTNRARFPDRLVRASTGIAEQTELYTYRLTGLGVVRQPLGTVEIGAGESIHYGPGGFYVRLTGLKQSLEPGFAFPVSLTFKRAGAVTVQAVVRDMSRPAHGLH
jgi:copper(I)-binding protein